MSLLKRIVCRLFGHRGVRTITNASLRDASISGLGFLVNGHRWDCSRCGSTGVRVKGTWH